jgi:hypothetical protein
MRIDGLEMDGQSGRAASAAVDVIREEATTTGRGWGRRAADLETPSPRATLHLPEGGGPLRTLFGLAHKHAFAMCRDPKSNQPNPVEGMTELALHMRLATDPDVGVHQTQPCRLELMVGSTLRSWNPDCLIVWRDGTCELTEVKIDLENLRRGRRELGGADYVAKLSACFAVLGEMGIGARVRYAEDILGPVERQINVGTLYPDRSAEIRLEHLDEFENLLADGAELAFGDLVAAIDPANPMQSQAVCHRLICAGRVWTDLDELLTEDSPVTLRKQVLLPNPLRAAFA